MTYNKINTYPYFKERVYKLEDDAGYDSSNVEQGLLRSFEWGDKIPLGVFYKAQQPIYEDSEPVLQEGPLVHQRLGLDGAVFEELVEEFV